ncbi:MAG: peptide chain release factor N(5)-glutamine methyltransferase, partial [Nitrospiraceae bacterium]|nr:peptide chain release factor N(5)-glutamine methyltransferase [Nitrospiraceae bacterium]
MLPPRALEALRLATRSLKAAGLPDAPKEAGMIMREGLGLNVLSIYKDNPRLTPAQETRLAEMLERRKKREPLQYILGFVWFYGLKLKVGRGVLIPRPETEILVEEALKRAAGNKDKRLKILDLCTGSGAIALALGKNLPASEVLASDISEKALSFAGENRAANGIENVRFLSGDLFAPVEGMRFDIITANPPYIKAAIIETLEPEVACWEPLKALSGGESGLELIERIISGAPGHLAEGGKLLMEIAGGMDRETLFPLAEKAGLHPEEIVRDFAGLER